ncbi:unnamed protein product [Adineta ricciae]|uniref:Cytochrome P450 n=1 Tax=Adineta ricciae TaxID=249248 RepID=A0A813WLY3_ADIRI|nr:unnamed protein product [Adineta ricciae]CAF0910678.1 unnamed protein product [Adineta ricciae]
MIAQALLYILAIVVLLVAFVYFKLVRRQKQLYDAFRVQGIKGEPFVPLVGQILELSKQRDNDTSVVYFQELAKKHGDVFLFGFGPLTRLMCNDPDLLADVLSRTNSVNYEKPLDFKLVFETLMGSHSLLVAEGNEHERARRMINPAFHHVNLKSMISIITDQTAKAIASLTTNKEHESKPVDLQIEFNALTLSIIVSSAFGADFETNTNAKEIFCGILAELLDAIEYRSMRMINQIPFLSKLPFWRKNLIDSGVRTIGAYVDQIIADRRQGRSASLCCGADLLDLLLSAVDDDGQTLTDQEIKEQSLTFVLAGSETTATLMVWILYVLMTHEDVQQACREEVDRILPNGIQPTDEHLSQLMVCEAVINETLRLYPAAPFFVRQAVHDHVIGTERQLHIQTGSTIVINTNVLHRRDDLWPRPNQFDYTRWMRDPKTGLKPKLSHPYAYLPFAAGPRNCIGQNFALLEAKLILAMLVQRCTFQMTSGQKIAPDVKITMRAKYGLWAKVSQRQI